jgi:hypothetical protein
VSPRPNLPELPPTVRMATSISVAACKCGCASIVVRLHDEAGEIYAAGSMTPDTAVEFNDQVISTIEGAVRTLVSPSGGLH